ncbi:MAG: monovalent cation/H(+) antiporter subunit G [Desulfohalobium sp.]
MMDIMGRALCLLGAFFFLAGTVGLLRFPDSLSRLHALTKADNLGLGFVAFGLMLASDAVLTAAKIGLIWGVSMIAGSTFCFLLGRSVLSAREARK